MWSDPHNLVVALDIAQPGKNNAYRAHVMSASCMPGERFCVYPAMRVTMGCDVHCPVAGHGSGLTHAGGIRHVVLDAMDSLAYTS